MNSHQIPQTSECKHWKERQMYVVPALTTMDQIEAWETRSRK